MGCAYRPVAIDGGQVFLGAFKSEEANEGVCHSNKVEGFGLKLGWSIVGIGYFNREVLTVKAQSNENAVCRNEFVTAFINECAIKSDCVIE